MCVRVCVYVREYIQLTHPAQKEFDIAELPRRKGGDYDGTKLGSSRHVDVKDVY